MTAELFRDPWGIPHVRGRDHLEVAYGQGRVTARDRGWQIEVNRWKAEGRLAERIGADGLEWDRFARRARLADTAQRAYSALSDEDRAFVDAYVAGVDDELALGPRHAGEPWPAWAPLGIMLVGHALFSNFPRLLWNEHVATTLGQDAIELFEQGESATSGSNAWALHGSRTASGRPLLAGDPHRMIELPGVYQQVRLACDEFDVLGLSFPGVPGVQHFGHAGSVAWGITNAVAYAVEVFRERLSDDGLQALGPDGWAPVTRTADVIHVLGGDDVELDVAETERGPIVVGDLSVRFPARATADVGFGCLLPLLRARTARDVADALRGWVDPVNRVLTADRAGTVLTFDAGLAVDRPGSARRLPIDAWSPAARRRQGHDSALAGLAGGWRALAPPAVVTDSAVDANEAPDRPERDLGAGYAGAYRAQRIRALLSTLGGPLGPEAMSTIHGDVRLGSAETLLTWVRRADGLSPAASELRDTLLAWDRQMTATSTSAGAYAAWRAAVARRIVAHPGLVPLHRPHGRGDLLGSFLVVRARVADALPRLLGATSLGIDGVAIAREALEEVGGLPPQAWGERHTLQPAHTLDGYGGPEVDAVPLSGDSDCVRCTGTLPGVTDRAWRGSVARWVWDLDDRRRSRWGVPFGASGDPGSPHASDQLATWAAAETVEVVTDWHQLRSEGWTSGSSAWLPARGSSPDVQVTSGEVVPPQT